MNRQQIEKLLAAYLLDELDGPTRAEMEAALENDSALRDRLADMRLALKLLHQGFQEEEEPRLSDDRRDALLKAVAQPAKPPATATRVWWRRRIPYPKLALAASILLLLGCAAAVFLPSLGRTRELAKQNVEIANSRSQGLDAETEGMGLTRASDAPRRTLSSDEQLELRSRSLNERVVSARASDSQSRTDALKAADLPSDKWANESLDYSSSGRMGLSGNGVSNGSVAVAWKTRSSGESPEAGGRAVVASGGDSGGGGGSHAKYKESDSEQKLVVITNGTVAGPTPAGQKGVGSGEYSRDFSIVFGDASSSGTVVNSAGTTGTQLQPPSGVRPEDIRVGYAYTFDRVVTKDLPAGQAGRDSELTRGKVLDHSHTSIDGSGQASRGIPSGTLKIYNGSLSLEVSQPPTAGTITVNSGGTLEVSVPPPTPPGDTKVGAETLTLGGAIAEYREGHRTDARKAEEKPQGGEKTTLVLEGTNSPALDSPSEKDISHELRSAGKPSSGRESAAELPKDALDKALPPKAKFDKNSFTSAGLNHSLTRTGDLDADISKGMAVGTWTDRSGKANLNTGSSPASAPAGAATGGEATKKPLDEKEALPPASTFREAPVNPWVMTDRDRFSTFALDVDTASYSLCRAYIQAGYLPPRGAVRMEEFVNAFDYNYPRRATGVFNIFADAAPAPFAEPGQDTTLLKVGVQGRVIGREGRKNAHLVFVIDTSGSMAKPDRLPLIQESLRMLVDALGPADYVTLVTFNGQASLVLEHVPASHRQEILAACYSLRAGGSTNLLAGLEAGYSLARREFAAGRINRVILCTDGVANIGQTDAEVILQNVAAYRKHGITLTVAGFGRGGYNDELLETLAKRGDGNYLFIDSPEQARQAFVEKMSATLQTIALDAKIQVEFNPARVRRFRLIGYEKRAIAHQDFRNDAVDAAEVGSGQSATALYELELTDKAQDESAGPLGTVYVRYRNADTRQIEEISQRLDGRIIRPRSVEQDPRFYLAACAARFAEILRESPHAKNGNFQQVERVIQNVSQVLPLDQQAKELMWMVHRAGNLPRAP